MTTALHLLAVIVPFALERGAAGPLVAVGVLLLALAVVAWRKDRRR